MTYLRKKKKLIQVDCKKKNENVSIDLNFENWWRDGWQELTVLDTNNKREKVMSLVYGKTCGKDTSFYGIGGKWSGHIAWW